MQSKKYADLSDIDNQVILGFGEKITSDIRRDTFPSKLGGLPFWIIPPHVSLSMFSCSLCNKALSFLLQLYCPLEDNNLCYHRYLYAFFCFLCWKKSDLIKVLRVQLPEISQYNNYDELTDVDDKGAQIIETINSHLRKGLVLEEYIISTKAEEKKASMLYFKFYNSVDEKSINSSLTDKEGDGEGDDDFIQVNSNEEKEVDVMLDNYLKDNQDFDMNKIEIETNHEQENDQILTRNEDLIFELFSKVVNYDSEQIIRYYRNDYYPLWFTQQGMLSVSNTKCRQCQGDISFEFQIMPYLFLLYSKISKIDIGTIVIYTCKQSCQKNSDIGTFIEEYGFIQRTGENFLSIEEKANLTTNNKLKKESKEIKPVLFKGVKEEDADDDGFIKIKQKKKKKE